jgi:hypothetical protein
MSTSLFTKLRAADDERRQAKRDSLAGKLTIEENALADLKVEKAKFDGDKKVVEADLARSAFWRAAWRQRPGRAAVVHPYRGAAARPGRGVAVVGRDQDTVVSARRRAGRP